MRKTLLAAACGFAFILAPPASADSYTYTYTGNVFTTLQGGDTCSGGATGTGECSIRGSFTLSTPLPSNVTTPQTAIGLYSVTFSFTDGVNTITNTTLAPGGVASFALGASNASGVPTSWDLEILDGPDTSFFELLSTTDSSSCGSSVGDFSGAPVNCGFGPDAFNTDSAGTWTLTVNTTGTTAAPEPSSLILLGTGLVGMVGRGLRRRRTGLAA